MLNHHAALNLACRCLGQLLRDEDAYWHLCVPYAMLLMGRLTTFRCNMITVQDHMPNHACHHDDQLFLPLTTANGFAAKHLSSNTL